MVSTASSRGLACLGCLLLPVMAMAGDWKFSSGLSLSERYSDNIGLRTQGQGRSDWITEVSPRLSVQRDGARLKVNADYNLQGLVYANDTYDDRLRHSLNGQANAELLEEWLFLDATARISHAPTSLGSSAGLGDPVGIENTTSVAAYSLSPYLKHRFGSFATLEARIGRNGVLIGNSAVTDTVSNLYSLNATSGSEFYPLSWGMNYSRTEHENDSAAVADSSSERASLSGRYQLTRKYGLLAQAGMEKNDFANASTRVRDYSYAGLGLFYTPSRRFSMDVYYNTSDNGNYLSGTVTVKPTLRTTLNASAGKRAYGRSYSLGLEHKARHSNWSLRYQDDLTTYQQQFLNYLGSVFYYACPTGAEPYVPGVPPSDPAACVLQQINYFNPTQINQTYLSRHLVGTVNYNLRRNTWTLSLFSNERELQGIGGGGGDNIYGFQASWAYRPASRTTYTLTAGMSQVDSSGITLGSRQDDLRNIGLTATHQFKPKLTGSVEVRRQERESNQTNGDYTENSVAARLNMTF